MPEKWDFQTNSNKEIREKAVKTTDVKELSKDEGGVFSDSQRKLIDQLKDLAQKLNRTPTVYDIDQASKEGFSASAHVFRKEFGTLNDARKSADLAVNREFKKENYIKPEYKLNYSIGGCILETVSLLQELDPSRFSPYWLEKNDRVLYKRIAHLLPRTENSRIEWKLFIEQLPEEWQKKWIYDEHKNLPGREKMSFGDCVKRVIEILEKEKPKKFDAMWMERNKATYYALKSLLPRNKSGQIKWGVFVRELPGEWQKKWRYLGYDKDIKEYSGDKEFYQLLKSFKDKLYTLVYYPDCTKEDKKDANKIAWEMVKLAQKGDINARIRLEKDLYYVCTEWIERYPELRSWKIAPKKIRGIIKSTILNFKFKSPFFPYLLYTLKKEQIRMPRLGEFKDWMRKKDDEKDV